MPSYYVDGTKADDSGDGLSEATAKKTLSAGLALATVGGDVVNIKSSTTYNLTTNLTFPTVSASSINPSLMRGYTVTPGDRVTRPLITTSVSGLNILNIGADHLKVENLHFTHSGATRGSGICTMNTGSRGLEVLDCLFDGLKVAINSDYVEFWGIVGAMVDRCEIRNCTGAGLIIAEGAISDSYIHNNQIGWRRANFAGNAVTFYRNIIARNNTVQLYWDMNVSGQLNVINCVVQGKANSSHGVEFNTNIGTVSASFISNVFELNGSYALYSYYQHQKGWTQINNAFRSNSSGDRFNMPTGRNDIILGSNPFISPETGNYNLNNNADGGKLLENIFTTLPGGTTAYSYSGVSQSSGGSGKAAELIIAH